MKTARLVQSENWDAPGALLGRASVEELIPYAKVGHFPPGSIVCSSDQWGECAYLVLRGKCEIRRKSSDNGPVGIQSVNSGESFGGTPADPVAFPFGGEVAALLDSVVLAVRVEDLEKLAAEPNGADVVLPGRVDVPSPGTSFFFNSRGNQVISFVFMSGTLPVAMLGEQIANQLQRETDHVAVLVEFENGATAEARRHEAFDHDLDDLASLPGMIAQDETGLYRLRLILRGDLPDPEVVGELFRKLRRRFHYVLVAIQAEQIPSAYVFRCVTRSDAVHFLLRPVPEDLDRLNLLLHDLRPRLDQDTAAKLKAVLCLANGQQVGGFDDRIVTSGMASPMQIREYEDAPANGAGHGSALFKADIRRLARTIGHCQVGLVLSSGGAKGLAHIGVIQVLEENGLDVDVVAGASMGAYVGSIWCCGHEGGKLEALAREMEVKRAMWSLIDPVVVPWQGFMRGYAVRRRLERSIGSVHFSDLARPLRVVAATLDTMERMVFSSGEVARAVHASIAVPGICIPVPIDGEYYVDGGIVDPLPTDVVREMGVNKIIAVNTIPTPERIRYCLQLARKLTQEAGRKGRSVLRKLLPQTQYANQYAHANVLDILMHSTHGAQMRVAEASSRQADVVLRPEICDDRWLDFRNPGFYIEAGRDVALRHLDKIKDLIKKKGASYEHESPSYALAETV